MLPEWQAVATDLKSIWAQVCLSWIEYPRGSPFTEAAMPDQFQRLSEDYTPPLHN